MDINKEDWNNFILNQNPAPSGGGSFLQSFEWALFQKSLGRSVWPIKVADQLAGLVIKQELAGGQSYLYCPRGPIFKSDSLKDQAESYRLFLSQLKKIAADQKAVFLKIEPVLAPELELVEAGFLINKKTIQPAKTMVLDLTQASQVIFEKMHPKTRYNIKLAQKKGVQIKFIEKATSEDIAVFLNLSSKTAARDKFSLHHQDYYRQMIQFLGQAGMIQLAVAEKDNRIIVANLICFFGPFVIYLHGASDYDFRKIMAPQLLQWQTILRAQELGFKYYDFWGIDEVKWPGVTRFKKGFNGQEINYPLAADYLFKPNLYRLYNLIKSIKRS